MKKQSVYIGIDLHGNNMMLAAVDKQGQRVAHKRVACDLSEVVTWLRQLKGKVVCIAVESTFNWYWLVDGLQDAGYEVVLANPAGMEQYSGLKQADDKTDAYFIAEMLRLEILPTGHICERELRSLRDMFRRRQLVVGKRTSFLLSLKNQHARRHGRALELARAKSLSPQEVAGLFEDPYERLAAGTTKEVIEHMTAATGVLEKACYQAVRKMDGHKALKSLPGIGPVLAATICLETGDLKRFASPECYASYCRTVESKKTSNDKKKGENNRKCGNRYLAWAFVEAANLARRYDDDVRRWYDRKAARTNKIIATKALACKLSKASWHLMRNGGTYDPQRLFGQPA